MFNRANKEPSRALIPIDDVVDNLPFIVRRDHRIVAAFARQQRNRLGRAAVVQRREPVYGAHGGGDRRRLSGRGNSAMSNRNLVPMPTHRARDRKAKARPAAAIAPSGLQAWHCFAFLIVAAVIWYAAKGPLIVIGVLAGFFWSLNWLCRRFPKTMYGVSRQHRVAAGLGPIGQATATGRRRRHRHWPARVGPRSPPAPFAGPAPATAPDRCRWSSH